MNNDDLVYVAGHRGLVGAALVDRLRSRGLNNLLLRSRSELDLTDYAAVKFFFSENRPKYVFLAAAKVGGIWANASRPAEFIRENLQIQTNIIDCSLHFGVEKLLFLGSSCIYPKFSAQPIQESSLLTGALEETNEAYAIAKIAGIKLCQAYRKQYGFNAISLMPTNLYGPRDNFDLSTSHVLPALIHKFHDAKTHDMKAVQIWGSGTPRREFLYVADLADACLFLMQNYNDDQIINVGVGEDISIAELAAMIGDVVGYKGEIVYDPSKPDGTPRKLLDVSRLAARGWRSQTSLEFGIRETYRWFLANQT